MHTVDKQKIFFIFSRIPIDNRRKLWYTIGNDNENNTSKPERKVEKMKATITISKETKISDYPRLKEVKQELKKRLPDLLPELTKINTIMTSASNGCWATLEIGYFNIISDVTIELVICRNQPMVCAHFWVNGFIDHKRAVCHMVNYCTWNDGYLDFDIVETGGTLSDGSPRYALGLDVFYSTRNI